MLDERAITKVIQRFCRGADRFDGDLVRSAFHEDATADYGKVFSGPAQELGSAEKLEALHAPTWTNHQHFVTNIDIDLDGDTAHVETYMLGVFRRVDGGGLDVSGGRYVDRFERRNGEWRIAHRVNVGEWNTRIPVDREVEMRDLFVGGRRDRSDVSYLR
ncbi:nuclear transport factor 2 family protein [Streptomyces sp. NPDC096311]|uniref:nuclear transport factor 2 family protein n=1 Tax=Streptomyces sp. NPDC096311 TaxID=3366083 RepID=UPI003826AC78